MPSPDSGSTADIHTAGVVSTIVSFSTWVLGRYVFHGSVPPEVTGIILLTIPYALALAGARVVRKRQLQAAKDAAYIRGLASPTGTPPGAV